MPPPPTSFRLAGIPVHVSFSGILGVLLLAYIWAPGFSEATALPGWVVALAFAVLFALAILVHEFSHALTARALGYPVQRVVLQFLGGVTLFERRRESPWREAAVAAAGPLATFAVAAASFAAAWSLPDGSVGQVLASALMWANLLMGVYNALPGLPLDGGNVVRCVIWALTGSQRRGTVVAAWVGRGVAMLTLLFPAWLLVQGGGLSTDNLLVVLAFAMVGSLLWGGASAELRTAGLRERASTLTAGALARRAIPVDRDLPLAEAIRRAASAGAGALVVVDHQGVPTGIGQHDAIAAVPEQRRPWVTVGAVARPLDEAAVISRNLTGTELITELGLRGRSELLVLDEQGLVYGVLLLSDVDAALRV